jgi:hypothetical protein
MDRIASGSPPSGRWAGFATAAGSAAAHSAFGENKFSRRMQI